MEWGFYYDVESNRMLEDPYIFTPSRTMTSSRITKESNAGLETYMVSAVAMMMMCVVIHVL